MKINDVSSAAQAQAISAKYQQSDQRVSSFEAALQKAAEKKDMTQLKQVAADFEEIFMNMLLKSMRQTVGDGGLIEKDNQSQIFNSMLDEAFAEKLANAGGVGISDLLIKQFENYIANENKTAQSQFDVKA